MDRFRTGLLSAALITALTSSVWAADPMSKEQAIEKATQAHPGEVLKAYQETKKGIETWEVKIKGADGKTWEVYYAVADGSLVKEEQDDD